MHNYLRAWKKFAVCRGRATRAEYWQFFLVDRLVFIFLYMMFILSAAQNSTVTWFWLILFMLYYLAVIAPEFSVVVRRLHDTNRSGWWMLVALIPLVGPFVFLYFLVQDSQSGENRYGPNPKEIAA